MLSYSLPIQEELKLEKKTLEEKNLRQDWQLYPLKCFFLSKDFYFHPFLLFLHFLAKLRQQLSKKVELKFASINHFVCFLLSLSLFLTHAQTQAPDIIISQSFLHFSIHFFFFFFLCPAFVFYFAMSRWKWIHTHTHTTNTHAHTHPPPLSLTHTHTHTHILFRKRHSFSKGRHVVCIYI